MMALKRFGWRRLLTHAALAGVSVWGCMLFAMYKGASLASSRSLTPATGYVALALIAASLVIGPLNLVRRKSNPANLDFRRDVGIWAGRFCSTS